MSLILDTDHLSILQLENTFASDRLSARLRQHPAEAIAVSIVSFQEQVQGWMAYLNQAHSSERIVLAYAKLEGILRTFLRLTVLPFNKEAQARFVELRKEQRRMSTLDLRIASIALTTGSTLLSRNLRDFSKVPALIVEDWTI